MCTSSNSLVVIIAYRIIPRSLVVDFIHWNSWSWYFPQEFITANSNLGGFLAIKVGVLSNFTSQNNWPSFLSVLHQSLFPNVKGITLRSCWYQGETWLHTSQQIEAEYSRIMNPRTTIRWLTIALASLIVQKPCPISRWNDPQIS